MTEQERKKAFENQRRNAERRAKEADGTYDMERRIQTEKKAAGEEYDEEAFDPTTGEPLFKY